MRFVISVFLLLAVLISIESIAAVPQKKVQELAASYLAQQDLWTVIRASAPPRPRPLPDPPPSGPHDPPHCPPDGGGVNTGCIEAVCERMSRFECDDKQDMMEVARECRNVSGHCVRSICDRVSRFACDEKYETFQVTEMCRGLFDPSCIEYVCSRISRFDCDELSEIKEIARQCR
ncbi:hypothetical protein QJS83_15725 [Bdellovibrio sp. 22V]|uniref:hypothetical protein n=1 Tax=Bdellovibrio sp. 22V TaxID=3044166 RepID=UPI002543EE53|nr:hypothetical protein [Bdellovibrio sp. 22V]WII71913.1 hypothetical protein QJS83_15725 [Bdellovibrio sp. 22V]